MTTDKGTLSFRVSSGLKKIIGRELISDKYIAIFELVKNSYDAKATKVEIEFITDDAGNAVIVISDDGTGMSYNDLVNKWLFVAYSEKSIKNRPKETYRDEIKRQVAGAKGVGRFSCDRLGAKLQIETKRVTENVVHVLDLDWDDFEQDDRTEFEEIPVGYTRKKSDVSSESSGTRLTISSLREDWNRKEYLQLKRSLMKLISPNADVGDLPFGIDLIVPSEEKRDEKVIAKKFKDEMEGKGSKDFFGRDIVNGPVKNDVFEKLNLKTTSIEVQVSEDGRLITTTLSDRGEFIFRIKERNRNYPELKNISIVVYYLNRSAKINFTRQMGGVEPKNYGSIFVYKSGFRVNPYGEPGQDFFGIDQRKTQGWKRYIGTREVIGRVEIKGDNPGFVETSSRAHGFVQNATMRDLEGLFLDRVLKPLEKYVVGLINWGEPTDKDSGHIISAEEIGEAILSQLFASVKSKDVVKVEYNPALLLQNSTSTSYSEVERKLKEIEVHAIKEENEGLLDLAKSIRVRTEALEEQNVHLRKEGLQHEKELAEKARQIEIIESQNLFLNNAADQEAATLINSVHSIFTISSAIEAALESLIDALESDVDKDSVAEEIRSIGESNQEIKAITSLVIHGSKSTERIREGDIFCFIGQYLRKKSSGRGMRCTVIEPTFTCLYDFNPVSLGIIVDNIVSNSRKAKATELKVEFTEDKDGIVISFTDDGMGIPEGDDVSRYFEWGYSANWSRKGAGIGLAHIKSIVEEANGSVWIDEGYDKGFKINVRLSNE